MKPKKMTGPAQVPGLSVPLLILASDRVREQRYANSQYKALLEVFRAAASNSILISVDGAGPLDYSDFPVKYPIISALKSGNARNKPESPAVTAEIITYFAASVLAPGERALLRDASLPDGTTVEAR